MELKGIVEDIMQLIREAMRDQIDVQGHRMTGKLSDSITFTVSENGSEVTGQMFIEDYGVYVEVGVSADRIPYGKGGGKPGGKSQYIQGLISFWEHKGLSGREAIGAAFATAKVHAREGMPSRSSSKYSQSGKRTGFIKEAVNDKMQEIQSKLSTLYSKELIIQFADEFKGPKIRIDSL